MSATPRSRFLIPLAVFAAGFLLRFLPLLLSPTVAHADEVFQAMEQAHRLVFGYGFVPWEFDYHARSWAMAVMAAGGMEIAHLLGGGAALYLPLVHASFATLGAATTLCVFRWGERIYGPWGGAAVALVCASWVDNIFFGGRSLTEVVAAHLLILGVYFTLAPASSWRGWLLGGLFAGAAIVLRLQLAPAAALLWIWPGVTRQRFAVLTAGAALACAAFGLLDVATGSTPFEPQWQNVRFNLLMGGGASAFGSSPWHFYIGEMARNWGASAALFAGLALLGARRQPILLAMALVILLAHMAIGHKEYRFIYPAIALLSILAGFGLVDLTRLIANGAGNPQRAAPLWLAVAVALVWSGFSLLNAAGRNYQDSWREYADMVSAQMRVAKMPSVCGVAFLDGAFPIGGYTYLHRRVPVFRLRPQDTDLDTKFTAVNVVIRNTERSKVAVPADFTRDRCSGTVCVHTRPGPCASVPLPKVTPGPLSVSVARSNLYPRVDGIE